MQFVKESRMNFILFWEEFVFYKLILFFILILLFFPKLKVVIVCNIKSSIVRA